MPENNKFKVEERVVKEFKHKFETILKESAEEEVRLFSRFFTEFLPIMKDGTKVKDGKIDQDALVLEMIDHLRSKIGKNIYIGQTQEDRDANDVLHLSNVLECFLQTVEYYKRNIKNKAIKKFPVMIGIKYPKIRLNGSPVIRCTFDPDFNFTSANSYSFIYDFKNGLVIEAEDVMNIRVPHSDLDFVASLWSLHSIDGDACINFHGDDIEYFHGVSEKELSDLKSKLDSKVYRNICEAVLKALN